MEPIVGIDFGTTNSGVALFSKGRAASLANECGERYIPSAVYIAQGGDIYVGTPAKNVSILHVDSTVLSVKREMGSGAIHSINGRRYTPEEIASYIFKVLKETASRRCGREITKAVVTVPAYYDDRRRQAVKEAAQGAGLEVVRLINEPTAAALAHGLAGDKEGKALVCDLGGGTFDVSVLDVREGVFEVLATRGDPRLGGDDFDRVIAGVMIERFKSENGIDLSKDRFALQKVTEEAERAKRQLSERRMVEIQIPFIAADERGPLHLSMHLTRAELDELIMPFIGRTVRLTKAALKDAGLCPADIDRLLLVGGSTRIPLVRGILADLFGKEPEGGVCPEEAVALGAAVQGGVLSGCVEGVALVDVTPLGLGVEHTGGVMHTMVPRNSAIPLKTKALFTTVQDFQKSVSIHVLQGERQIASDNISLGSFKMEGIRRAPKGEPKIEVTFEIDTDGIVHVSAEDLDTRSSFAIQVDNTMEVPAEEVSARVTEARASELDDLRASSRGGRVVN